MSIPSWGDIFAEQLARDLIVEQQHNDNVARQKGCQACPVKTDCLPLGQKRRYIGLTKYYPLHLRARERNRTAAYHREQINRRTISEGPFASLDRMNWGQVPPARAVEGGRWTARDIWPLWRITSSRWCAS